MNPAIKKLWIAAALSGRYQQGRGYLRQVIKGRDYYCIQGVLCDLAVQVGIIVPPEFSLRVTGADEDLNLMHHATDGEFRYGRPGVGSFIDLPEAVRAWAGLPIFGYIEIGYMPIHTANDVYGMTFPQLARQIDEHL